MPRLLHAVAALALAGVVALPLGFLFAPDPTGALPLLFTVFATPVLAFGLYRWIDPDEDSPDHGDGLDADSAFDRRK